MMFDEEWLKDIFVELELNNMNIDMKIIRRPSVPLQAFAYEINIERPKTFLLEDVYDYILTCESYLKANGLFIQRIHGVVNLENSKNGYRPETYLISKHTFYNGGLKHIDNVKSSYRRTIIEEHPVWWVFIKKFNEIKILIKNE